MDQFLVIIRGAPASGKTTIAKNFRDFSQKIVWLKVDNFKDFFSEEGNLDEQGVVDGSALATLEYLLDQGYSAVMEKVFYNPEIISLAEQAAKKRGIKSIVFQISCPLETLLERDQTRPGIKEGCRKPLGSAVIEKLFQHLDDTYYPNAIKLDTEKMTIEECVGFIKREINNG